VSALVPLPTRATRLSGTPLDLNRGLRFGKVGPSGARPLGRFVADLGEDGLDWLELNTTTGCRLDVEVRDSGPGDDEGYLLRVAGDRIEIDARRPVGLHRALTTLRQLVLVASAEGHRSVEPLEVSDACRYPWRGLSLDVARCFFDIAEVKRVIDLLSFYKLNVLHLHLTDDQGWRIDVPALPALSRVGGSRSEGEHPAGCYTLEDYRDIVEYAAERYVTVVPEIDMPGHCAAAIAAYPELGGPGTDAGPANLLHPDRKGVMEFVASVLGELAAATPGPYLHIGGDEAFGLGGDPYRRFVAAAREIVRSLGKTPVTWQEGAAAPMVAGDVLQHWLAFDPAIEAILATGDATGRPLPEGFAFPMEMVPRLASSVRRSRADLARAVGEGARVVLSPATHTYLDRPYSEGSVLGGQGELADRLGLRVYAPATVEEFFDWDPAAALPFPLEAGAVLGVEAAMWSESLTGPADLEFMLLPRLAGLAERGWSERTDWAGHAARLARHRPAWEARGWAYFASELLPWGDL
jgi:hexosaminidase